jgi:hypothetical protein
MNETSIPLGFPTFMVDGAPLALITGEELATAMRYKRVCGAFRAWCQKLGITTVEGRNNLYDPKHVRARLDAAQGAQEPAVELQQKLSLTEQRKARRGK